MTDEDELAADPTAEWNRLVADAEAVATAYRDEGRETVVLDPTDVSVVPADGEAVGIVALVDDGTFDRVRALADGHGFSDEVHRVPGDELVFLVVAFERDDGEAAIVAPLYYERTPAEEGELRRHDGTIHTRVRDLAGVEVVSFAHDDPAALLPERRFDES